MRSAESRAAVPGRQRSPLVTAWLVGLLPFAAASLAMLLHREPPCPVRQLTVASLPGPVYDLHLGSDRSGDRVSLTDARGRIHVLSLREGRLRDTVLTLPWAPREMVASGLLWEDLNHDDRLDLRVIPFAPESDECVDGMVLHWRAPTPRRQAVGFVSDGDQYRQTIVTNEPRYWNVGQAATQVVAGGASYLITGVGDGAERTRVVGSSGTHQTLLGMPLSVGDMNEDGQHEVLTASRVTGGGDERACYRLYTWVRNGFREIWRGQRTVADPALSAIVESRPLGYLADLDSDGRCELVLLDSRSGRVDFSTWDDALTAR